VADITSFILDTSAYSAFNRGEESLRKWFQGRYEIAVPFIVLGELRAGFAAGTLGMKNDKLLRRFLDSPNVYTLPISAATTEHFAYLFSHLRKNGIAIGTNDLWIAALSKEHALPILTMDKDFERIDGIELVEASRPKE
jgi:tRNA(fMet)-specific endonuclease VapC